MQLIGQIINDLVNDQTSLGNALNKTKVLASRIGQQELLSWANSELSGYQSDELPEYRKFRGNITVDYMDGYQRGSNFPVTLDFDAATVATFENASLVQGVPQLEQMIGGKPKGLRYEFNSTQRYVLQQMLQGANGPYFQLTSAGINLPDNAVHAALTAIRQRLLDFMLELESRFGMETDIVILKANHQVIHQYMQTTIHNNGDGNVINTGDHAQVNAQITITQGNKEQLRHALEDKQVAPEDTKELLMIIDSEQPDTKGLFGQKVNAWIAKMVAKSLDGSWQIAIGAAGGFLAEAIGKYYGIS